jgi:hypothetical protein
LPPYCATSVPLVITCARSIGNVLPRVVIQMTTRDSNVAAHSVGYTRRMRRIPNADVVRRSNANGMTKPLSMKNMPTAAVPGSTSRWSRGQT